MESDVFVQRDGIVEDKDRERFRYGTAGPWGNLFESAWTAENHVFAAVGAGEGTHGARHHLGHPSRVKSDVLSAYPVDVLAVEDGEAQGDKYWARWLDGCLEVDRPSYVVISAAASELVNDHGLQSKPWRVRFKAWGYSAHYWFLRGHEHGGVVRQDRCFLILHAQGRPWVPAPAIPEVQLAPTELPRAAHNMLRCFEAPRRAWYRHQWGPVELPPWVKDSAFPCQIVGETTRDHRPVFTPKGCLPNSVGALIETSKGVRSLQATELGRAKGIPSTWDLQGRHDDLTRLTGQHLWVAVSDALFKDAEMSQGTRAPSMSSREEPVTDQLDDDLEWEWELPDLSEGGEWYQERVTNLERAIQGRADHQQLRAEGLAALAQHRRNYGPEGIDRLQLLWWEFPPEHWEELRDGCRMNFLDDPDPGLIDNSTMDGEQLDIAAEFVDDLTRIGVLEAVPEEVDLLANAPLFSVPKPGQPGEWRIIADMKRGGQNDYIGADPVHLPRAGDILSQLYSGGWSAIVDASKYFHNFPTHPDDRPYLGCIHPRTGRQLWYLGLPMGSTSSPGIACRFGNSMLRDLVSCEPVFQGVLRENSWRSYLGGEAPDPALGSGLVRIGEDGLPAALVWGFVDDFKVHGPTKQKLITALNAFMDKALCLGIICQKVKLKAPAQVQKYCGFIYDTRDIPTLRIPEDKRTRALAVIRYLLAGGPSQRLSRLALSVGVGLLQSLVDATPHRIGQTFLRRLYDRLHEVEGEGKVPLPTGSARYFTRVYLSPEDQLDLRWWEAALGMGIHVQASHGEPGSLAIAWGDGSGTGTGGTFQVIGHDYNCAPLEAWMGTWRPVVHSFSSNWKELRTLVHSLDRLAARDDGPTRCTLFYFTDNLVTYYIVTGGSSSSSELQKLIRRIKLLELQLNLKLEVVHVPGTHMITQGTDGLSRGIPMSLSRLERPAIDENRRLFQGVPYSRQLHQWVEDLTTSRRHYPRLVAMDPLGEWDFHDVVREGTLWLPAPEWAHQVMNWVVNFWVEVPWHTECFFLVPRVFQRKWGRVSKYIREVGVFDPALVPGYGGLSDIPCVLLHLPCHVRCRSAPRLDRIARPTGEHWHRRQAEHLRGL